jgi:serine/threonine-protein kinase HipA
MKKSREVFVYAHWTGMSEPVFAGTLHAHDSRGQELFEFQYDAGWLKTQFRHLLDPQLSYHSGSFFPKAHAANFGLFLDAAPGEWGRALMQRKESALAAKEKRAVKNQSESDFLLGVFDFYRAGALRFKTQREGEFVTSDEQFILPSLASLRELEQAAIKYGGESFSREFSPALETLAATGVVLGGKRPKVTVIDNDWQMWIAKFPQANDRVDVGAWEFVAHTMAGLAGINTVQGMSRKLNGHHHTFMAERFDRTPKGERIHFATANTLLGMHAGHFPAQGYLDLAGFIMRHGADVNSDLQELWRRIVFSIAIRNTGDHLGNHGFLLTRDGWRLSPVYDLNPDPEGNQLSLNISEHDSSADFELALSVAEYFRVKAPKAKSILQEVKLVAGMWRKIASDAGITKGEQEKMERAFER